MKKVNISKWVRIVGLLAITSCDNRYDFIAKQRETNAVPVLTLNGAKEKPAADSAKYSLKVKQESITLNFTANDDNSNLKHVVISRVSGDSAYPDKETIAGNNNVISDLIKFTIKKTGVSVFDLTAVNVLGGSTTRRYTLTVFENLPPATKLAATPSRDNKYLYALDAGGSKDGDQKFGGYIQIYRYTIDGIYTFDTASPSIPRTFFTAGRHAIKLVTVDNEGMASEALNLDINIPQ